MPISPRVLIALAALTAIVAAVAFWPRSPDAVPVTGASPTSEREVPGEGMLAAGAPEVRLEEAALYALVDRLAAGDDPAAVARLQTLATRHSGVVATLIAELRIAAHDLSPGGDRLARALGAIGEPAVGPLREEYASADLDEKRAILQCFGYAGPAASAATPEVTSFLRESRGDARLFPVEVLGRMGKGSAAAGPDLAAILLDGKAEEQLSEMTVRALAGVGAEDSQTLEALRAVLEGPRRSLHALVLRELATIGPAAAPLRAHALTRFDDEDPEIVATAAELVGAIGVVDDAALGALSRLFVEERGLVRGAAGRALAGLGPEGISALVRIAKAEGDMEVRFGAILMLASNAPDSREHVVLLLKIVDEQHEAGWRIRALDLLATFRPPARASEALPAIRRALEADNVRLAIAALRAAASLDGEPEAVVGILLEALSRGEAERAVAASLLGKFGAQARRIVPALLAALSTPTARAGAIGSLRALLLAEPEVRAEIARAKPDDESAAELNALLAATRR